MKKIAGNDVTLSIPMLMSGDRFCDPAPEGEISLYVHLPFCKYQCPYCHFYVVKNSPAAHQPLIHRLLQEDALYNSVYDRKIVRSIYFGGGTPSLVDANLLDQLLSHLSQNKKLHPQVEITLEANPETVTPETLAAWKGLGINRISLGVQSLVERELLALGRGHHVSTAYRAIEAVAGFGFRSFSLDLMMEIPHQTPTTWDQTLKTIQAYKPPHLSLYNLVIEPGTPFSKREKQLKKQIVKEDVGSQMLAYACESLLQIGLERYEISAFAQKGHESIHNTGYWRGRDFIGLGPSAFSFFEGRRLQNIANLQAWGDKIDRGEQATDLIDELSKEARIAELLAIHLRLFEGVCIKAFEARWGSLPPAVNLAFAELKKLNWIEEQKGLLKLTDPGRLFYERVASELILIDE